MYRGHVQDGASYLGVLRVVRVGFRYASSAGAIESQPDGEEH